MRVWGGCIEPEGMELDDLAVRTTVRCAECGGPAEYREWWAAEGGSLNRYTREDCPRCYQSGLEAAQEADRATVRTHLSNRLATLIDARVRYACLPMPVAGAEQDDLAWEIVEEVRDIGALEHLAGIETCPALFASVLELKNAWLCGAATEISETESYLICSEYESL